MNLGVDVGDLWGLGDTVGQKIIEIHADGLY